jgi:hypothetical protein
MFNANKLLGITATGLTPATSVNLRWDVTADDGTPAPSGAEGPLKIKASGILSFPLDFNDFGTKPGIVRVWLADPAGDQDVSIAGFDVEVQIP